MLAAIQGMETSYVWSGIIWSIVMGLAAGNYACSLIHRLPRGRLLLDKPPYCGHCGTLLQVKDLFPVISAVLLRHRCRYCKTPFPASHTITELLLASIFILSFLYYDFSDMYVLICLLSSFLIILAAIEVNENIIIGKVMVCVAVVGMLIRTYLDDGLFNFVQGGLLGAILGAIIWNKSITKEGHIYRLPKQAELLAVAGVCVGAESFAQFLALFISAYIIFWTLAKIVQKPLRVTIPISVAIFMPIFFGNFLNL